MVVVVKIGGSVFTSPKTIQSIVNELKGLKRIGKLAVVVGGGPLAEEVVSKGRKLKLNEYELDSLAIDVTRLNAKLLALAMNVPYVPTSVDLAIEYLNDHDVVVMGGSVPGHTTNTVAALLAESLECELVNVTNVNGVYDKDPKLRGAKKFKTISHEDLVALAAKNDSRSARSHFIFDLLAAKILARSKIRAHVVKLSDLKNAVKKKPHSGTTVSSVETEVRHKVRRKVN